MGSRVRPPVTDADPHARRLGRAVQFQPEAFLRMGQRTEFASLGEHGVTEEPATAGDDQRSECRIDTPLMRERQPDRPPATRYAGASASETSVAGPKRIEEASSFSSRRSGADRGAIPLWSARTPRRFEGSERAVPMRDPRSRRRVRSHRQWSRAHGCAEAATRRMRPARPACAPRQATLDRRRCADRRRRSRTRPRLRAAPAHRWPGRRRNPSQCHRDRARAGGESERGRREAASRRASSRWHPRARRRRAATRRVPSSEPRRCNRTLRATPD